MTKDDKGEELDRKENYSQGLWRRPLRKPDSDDRKRIFRKVIEVAIVRVMEDHCYKFNGKVYRQGKGGSIGLRLTSLIARIVMDRWSREMKILLKKNNINYYLFLKYVDDINTAVDSLKKGTRWNGEKVIWNKECENEDVTNNKSVSWVTGDVLRDMANSIRPYLKFTTDLPEDHPNLKVPMLDLQVWTEKISTKCDANHQEESKDSCQPLRSK